MYVFRIRDLDGVGQVWYCNTEDHKNKIIYKLEKLGRRYEVTERRNVIISMYEKISKLEKQARDMIAAQTTTDLFDEWELTINSNDPQIPTIRGWLMDEFEKRNPEGFEKWLDGNALDEELRYYV